jgi:hypothetical protein
VHGLSSGSSTSKLARELALVCLAFVPRLAYLLMFRPPFETTYWALAGTLLRTGSFASGGVRVTDFEPLYPIFLAACRAIAGDRAFVVQLFQIGVSSAGAVFLYRLALRLAASPLVSIISVALFAFHPLLVRQASEPSDLALASTLLIVFAYAFVAIHGAAGAAAAGAALGLAVLTRFMMLPLAVCGFVILVLEGKRGSAGVFIIVALLFVSPWVFRTRAVNGSWWPTRSGINLFIGNSPYTSALLPDYDLDLIQDRAYALFVRERPDLDPSVPEYAAALDAFLTRQALGYIASRPLETLRQKAVNVWYCFSPRLVPFTLADSRTRVMTRPTGEVFVESSVPRPRIEVVAYALASSFVLVAAVAGIWLRRRLLRRDRILWAIVATFTVVNALYVPASRYGAPMMFVLLFYAAVASARLEGGWYRQPATLDRGGVYVPDRAMSSITVSRS